MKLKKGKPLHCFAQQTERGAAPGSLSIETEAEMCPLAAIEVGQEKIEEAPMGCAMRNRILRDKTCVKSLGRKADKNSTRQDLKICLERARVMTRIFKATEGRPMCLRRAMALAAHLYSMTLFTRENELIVGCYASSENSLPTYPELYWRWLEKAVDTLPDYSAMLTGEEKKELLQIHEYWRTMSIHGREWEYIPEGRSWRVGDFVSGWMWQWEASTPNYEKVLQIGLNGILAEITARLKAVESGLSIPIEKRMRMIDELTAMRISIEAASHWGQHYAMMLLSHQERVRNHERAQEIDRMIEVCKHVPAEPARNLHEALQCFVFINLITSYIDQPQAGNGIRFDKVFGPYLEKDLKTGVLTRSQAKELVGALWVKMQEGGYLQPPQLMRDGGSGLGFQTITLGGTDEKGNDITNEMTYLALEVCGDLQTITPQIAVRIHDGTPSKLYKAIFRCIRTGCSQPVLFNDNVNIPGLMELGCPENEARLYSVNNCMRLIIPGKNIHYRTGHTGGLILPMCLMLALSGGKLDIQNCKLSGRQVGYPTAPVSTFTTYEDVWNAFCKQVECATETVAMIADIADILLKDWVPRPFLSALLDGNIEKGCDMRDWEYLGLRQLPVFGCTNAANKLAAIKKLVFEEKKLTLEEYVRTLEHSFKGTYDYIYQMTINEMPGPGEDSEYADAISNAIMNKVGRECDMLTDIYGNRYLLDGAAASVAASSEKLLSRFPGARKASDLPHDGSSPPFKGRKSSPAVTAVRPATRTLDHKTGNLLLNQKFMLAYFDPPDYKTMEGCLKTLMDMPIQDIQFICNDGLTLLKARERPDDYRNLIVPVRGYSAYFVDLDNRMQEEIIRRAEQTF